MSISGSGYALTLAEEPLAAYGFPGVTTDDTSQCASFSFAPFPGFGDGNYTIITLHPTFNPAFDPDANITLFLNEDYTPFATIISTDVEGGAAHHVIIPASEQTSTISIRLCANPSAVTQTILVSETGTIGRYQMPRFDQNGDFETYIAGTNPILGKEIQVSVKVHNSGTLPGDVKVDYRKYPLDYIPLVKGETGFTERIYPGETKVITYSIKPLRPVQILLPPAVLTFTTIFGEEKVLESTRAYLDVDAPIFNVKGAFLVPQNQIETGQPIQLEWIVQNDGLDPVEDVRAIFTITPGERIAPETLIIPLLHPARAETRVFTVTFSEAGTYELGCTLTSASNPTLSAGCQSATLQVVHPNPWVGWGISLLVLLVSIGVYLFIISPSKPVPEPPKPKKRFQPA